MELDLIQTAPTMPSNAPDEFYFTVTGYDIKVKGENATIQEKLHSHKVSMDQDTIFLTSLGTLEVENEEEEGITKTQIMPVNGIVKINEKTEDSNHNITNYTLREGGLIIGDISMMDFGVDFDSVFLSGNLTVSPSEEDADRLTGKLLLEGSE